MASCPRDLGINQNVVLLSSFAPDGKLCPSRLAVVSFFFSFFKDHISDICFRRRRIVTMCREDIVYNRGDLVLVVESVVPSPWDGLHKFADGSVPESVPITRVDTHGSHHDGIEETQITQEVGGRWALDEKISDTDQNAETRFRVSSEASIMNSLYFEKMLTGPWKESVQFTDASKGPKELRLKNGEDEKYLLLLLNILHG